MTAAPRGDEQRLLAEVAALEAELDALAAEAHHAMTARDHLEEQVSALRCRRNTGDRDARLGRAAAGT